MRKSWALAVVLMMAKAAAAAAPGDPGAGRDLAQMWCASCHALPGAARANDQVPTLATATAGRSATQLSTFLTRPHPPMPPLQLSRGEIADLVAYVSQLPRP